MKRTVYWIEGDGIGADVWSVARPVIDTAIKKAYGSEKQLEWVELLAGKKALQETGELLPEATINTLKHADLAIKGPLETPVGKGFRSLNVTMRQIFDLYACVRPIHYFQGIESPVKCPELINMTIFRENTEDVYAGIEYQANSPEAKKLFAFLTEELGAKLTNPEVALGIKPISEMGSKRLVRAAVKFALANKLPSITLVHKGNIMKFTEGAFRQWGYDMCEQEFADVTTTEAENAQGKLIIKDRIADAMFQEALINPQNYSVLATCNLNGDYLSDAIAAQVGGLGLAPGVNYSDSLAFFEATHGTAPAIAGQDKANPGSLILCGAMLLEHIGWHEAATSIKKAITTCITKKLVTEDLARQMKDTAPIKCSKFGEHVIEYL